VKVVGIGSVGTRCFIILFFSEEDYPLILQFNKAGRSVLEPYILGADRGLLRRANNAMRKCAVWPSPARTRIGRPCHDHRLSRQERQHRHGDRRLVHRVRRSDRTGLRCAQESGAVRPRQGERRVLSEAMKSLEQLSRCRRAFDRRDRSGVDRSRLKSRADSACSKPRRQLRASPCSATRD